MLDNEDLHKVHLLESLLTIPSYQVNTTSVMLPSAMASGLVQPTPYIVSLTTDTVHRHIVTYHLPAMLHKLGFSKHFLDGCPNIRHTKHF